MRGLGRAMIAAHRVDPKLHKIFNEEVPRMGPLTEVEAIKEEIFNLVRGYLDQHQGEIDIKYIDTAAFICVTTMETLSHELVIRRSHLSVHEEEIYVEHITRLSSRYIND